jgi:hypothetical protein
MSTEKEQEQLWNACSICNILTRTIWTKTVDIATKRISQTNSMMIAINSIKVANWYRNKKNKTLVLHPV